jgi:hypothetical protein
LAEWSTARYFLFLVWIKVRILTNDGKHEIGIGSSKYFANSTPQLFLLCDVRELIDDFCGLIEGAIEAEEDFYESFSYLSFH